MESVNHSTSNMVQSNRNQGTVPKPKSKKKIVVIGSSHAKRLFLNLKDHRLLHEKYYVLNETIPGSTFENTKFPAYLSKLKKDDFVILQLFGNDWLKKHIQITKEGKNKMFHLTKFEPVDVETVMNMLLADVKLLAKILKNLKCKILMIDNIFRHLECCEKHQFQEIGPLWSESNKALRLGFKDFKNVTCIDHRKLLGFPKKKIKVLPFYKTLLVDGVHLKPKLYKTMATNLISQHILTQKSKKGH
jgi:hypothetical protein